MSAMNPQFGAMMQNPQARAMLSNPDFLRQMSNPANIQVRCLLIYFDDYMLIDIYLGHNANELGHANPAKQWYDGIVPPSHGRCTTYFRWQ